MDEGKLDSALHAPRQAFDGEDMYPTLASKAAVLLYSIAKAHALPNGNKRMAMVSTFLFVGMNRRWWAAESEEVRAHVTWLAASLASARDEAITYMAEYFESRLVPMVEYFAERGIELEAATPAD